VLSATAQYIGAVIAIDLFDQVNPATVALVPQSLSSSFRVAVFFIAIIGKSGREKISSR
jgi:hypothetical protein